MSELKKSHSARLVVGYALSPVLPSLIYAWTAWEEAFSSAVYIITLVAYMLAFVPLLPAHLLIFRIRKYNLYISGSISFILLFVVFFLFYIAMASKYNALAVGPLVLVEEGQMTWDGYLRAIKAASIVGLHGVIGSVIFSIFARGCHTFDLAYAKPADTLQAIE